MGAALIWGPEPAHQETPLPSVLPAWGLQDHILKPLGLMVQSWKIIDLPYSQVSFPVYEKATIF